MNLPDLIDFSKTSEFAREILDRAVCRIYGDSKPITEILNRLEEDDDTNNESSKSKI